MAHLLAFQPSQPGTFAAACPGRRGSSAPASLIQTIQSAAQRVPDTRLRPVIVRRQRLPLPPRVLLIVLTYCHVLQIYSARKIRERMFHDPACMALGGGEFPALSDLREFRQFNRAELEKCLVTALRFLCPPIMAATATGQKDEGWVAEEAKRRLLWAACLDCMELDDDCFSC